MAYSWSGSSALGFDLARRRGGREVARVLFRGLAADEAYVTALARRPPAGELARAAALARLDAADTRFEIALTDAAPGRTPDGGHDPLAGLRSLKRRVEAIRFGDSADLIMLGADSLHAGLDVAADTRDAARRRLSDAVTAALLRASGDPGRGDLADELDAGYRRVGAEPAGDPDLGPGGPGVVAVLDRLHDAVAGGTTGLDLLALRAATRTPDASQQWVDAMHAVSWAVELSGRTRPMAAAHLMLVDVLLSSGLGPEDCAGWAWNMSSGMVAAEVVADLMPQEQRAILVGGATA